MNLFSFFPGIQSYRGRYLYLTAFILLILGLFTFTSWHQIYQANKQTHQHIIKRNQNASTLNSIVNQFQQIRALVYQYALTPESVREIHLVESVTELLELTERMDISGFDDIDSSSLNNFIVQIPTRIHDASIRLIAVRSNSTSWIPATRIMQEQLRPLNETIVTTLNDILVDNENSQRTIEIQSRLQRSALNLKITWALTISEFRLIVSNRMGIFGSSKEGIQGRLENMDLLIQQLRHELQQLKQVVKNDDHEFISSILIPQLEQQIREWLKLHKYVVDQLLQKSWRKDLPELEQIEQLFSQFSDIIVDLRNDLNLQANRDIKDLNEISHLNAFFFMMLSILGLILAILSYLYFDRNILQPISNTTYALLEQSKGNSQELNFDSNTSESRELIDAFNHMREQIIQREKRLDFMAHHDTLTNLPNRLMFNERLQHAIQLANRSQKIVVLMLLDLDRFKLINDTLGHLFGDKLLQETAKRLKTCLRSQDTVARLGGDEFAIILENISSTNEVNLMANKIKRIFSEPFLIEKQEIHASTSIGIAIAPNNTSDRTTLIRYADIAMYQSKNMGRNQYTWFSSDLENAEESIINFENKLREAITQHQFELHFQPIINLNNPQLISCEALLRWRHPEKGLIYPEHFLNSLDNSALLFDLTCWVIRESARFQEKVKHSTGINPCISINLATVIFQQPQYREKLETLLCDAFNDASRITLEVTEAALSSDMKTIAASLNLLHHCGFRIALDDFGSGQSSLSHLRVFPIDIIKIDQEFIRDVIVDQDDANLVSAIISLARDMGLDVVSEAVENREQYEFLKARQCELMQGNYFAEPMPAEEYFDYLRQHKRIT